MPTLSRRSLTVCGGTGAIIPTDGAGVGPIMDGTGAGAAGIAVGTVAGMLAGEAGMAAGDGPIITILITIQAGIIRDLVTGLHAIHILHVARRDRVSIVTARWSAVMAQFVRRIAV